MRRVPDTANSVRRANNKFDASGSVYAFTPTSAVYELEGLEFPHWALVDRHEYSGALERFTFPRSSKPRPSDNKP